MARKKKNVQAAPPLPDGESHWPSATPRVVCWTCPGHIYLLTQEAETRHLNMGCTIKRFSREITETITGVRNDEV